MKKLRVTHPYLFAMFPILGFFAYNISQGLSLYLQTAIALGISLSATFLLFFILNVIFKDSAKTGLILSLFVLLFFSYGHLHDMLEGILTLESSQIGPDKILLLSYGLLLGLGTFVIMKIRKNLCNLIKILNVVALSLIIMPLLSTGIYKFKTINAWRGDALSLEDQKIDMPSSESTGPLRDIYFIILDMYANTSTLREVFDYDNSDFENFLMERDFYITPKSRSNYTRTYLSLSAALNMEYVNYLSAKVGVDSKDWTVPHNMVRNSKVVRLLKSRGYKFVNVSAHRNKYADLNIGTRYGGNEFQMVLIQTTLLKPFVERLIKHDRRERILNAFSKLGEVPLIKGPKYVFAHILAPHPPFLFGRDGEFVPESKLKMLGDVWEDEGYLNQLIFVNKKVKVLVEQILANSETPPIIIMQGDHGSFSTIGDRDPAGEALTDANAREIFRIFSAFYFPGDGRNSLYDSISPVNNFRVIFNAYFNGNYELLEDRSYYSQGGAPYNFFDVTEQAKFD